jgi:glycine hydroxymethyltransferase
LLFIPRSSSLTIVLWDWICHTADSIYIFPLSFFHSLTHGYMTKQKRVSATSVFWESMPYRLDEVTGLIDYEKLESSAMTFLPKLIIAGFSAYSRKLDYGRIRAVCDKVDAIMMTDMAHVGGLVAAGNYPSPFELSDVVTTTTHKTLRGPRAGLIFYRKGEKGFDKKGKPIIYDLENKINSAVFPALQGGPHQNAIAAISTALLEVNTPMFRDYSEQVCLNCAHLAKELVAKGYTIVSGGTDNHLVLVDLRSKGIDGARVEKVLESCGITVNKNSVPGDTRPFVPGGVRIGTPALTSRGLKEKDFSKVVEFLDRGIKLAVSMNETSPEASTNLKKFNELCQKGTKELDALKKEVEDFALVFPMP